MRARYLYLVEGNARICPRVQLVGSLREVRLLRDLCNDESFRVTRYRRDSGPWRGYGFSGLQGKPKR